MSNLLNFKGNIDSVYDLLGADMHCLVKSLTNNEVYVYDSRAEFVYIIFIWLCSWINEKFVYFYIWTLYQSATSTWSLLYEEMKMNTIVCVCVCVCVCVGGGGGGGGGGNRFFDLPRRSWVGGLVH